MKKNVLAVLLSTVWISISEFTRNQFLLASYWEQHYKDMGLTFPAQPVNGAVWGSWATVFSVFILVISKKFAWFPTAFLAWIAGFLMMWLVIGNLGVLPFAILYLAIPLSLLEAGIAAWIMKKIAR